MRISKNNLAEYQKCGQIMVAVKKNKMAMVCNYCQNTFTQMPGFMRHLQQQHNDELEFGRHNKEVEVYAVEELLNQTVSSCAPDIDSEEYSLTEEDAKWLSKEDIKWLKDGVDPKKTDEEIMKNNTVEEGDLGLVNVSILKALEDCDVSFNLNDNSTSTKCEDEDNNSANALLREIQNDWEDSDTNDSILKRFDCIDMEELHNSKHVMDISKELEAVVTMTEMPQGKDIKNLLQNLEDLHDVDSLLENLEGNLVTNTINGELDQIDKNLNKKLNGKINGKLVKPNSALISINNCKQNLRDENYSQNKILLNTELINKLLKYNRNIENLNELNKLVDFETTHLTQIENALDDCITSNITNDFALTLRDIEESLCNDRLENELRQAKPNSAKNAKAPPVSVENFENDFESQLKDLEESLNAAEMLDKFTTETLKEITTKTDSNIHLNEDLTKALADALGDDMDFDLLNMQTVEENEEPLNPDLQNLLDMELMDTEIEEVIQIPKEQHIVKTTEVLKESTMVKSSKKQPQSLVSAQNNIKSKYQNTNLKIKTKLIDTHSKNISKISESLELEESNYLNSINIQQSKQIPFKRNHDIFLQQQQLTGIDNIQKSPAKTPTQISNNCKILTKSQQRKSPNKENNTSAFNIKNEIQTPASNFINTNRGDKTPLKRQQMFSKQSPKTQEKQKALITHLTPQEKQIKESPKSQEKQENPRYQHTPPATSQIIKQSPKTQEKLNQTSPDNKTPNSKNKGHIKSNEKPFTNACTSLKQIINYNHSRTPLTTPQRLRNVAIKLQRFTPDKLGHKATKHKTILSPPKTQSTIYGSQEIAERFKLPKGISVTKIDKTSSSEEADQSEIIETPVKNTTYCKQNFSELSLESITAEKNTKKESPTLIVYSNLLQSQNPTINNLKAEDNSSKLRQRKASIDIIPSSIAGNGQQDNLSAASRTPRHSNLDYKSYTVNRTARKKEVLQRMRHIKKQIFKSIENGECVSKVNRLKSPQMKQQKKRKIVIENVQILPNLNKEALTPLINPFNNFKKPFAINAATTTPSDNSVSPKNFADVQKQVKVSLETSEISTPIIDDEKFFKRSMKRPASSPLLNEEKQAKRQHKSPTKNKHQVAENLAELEATQLDLSESVVEFLQRDLKRNRLNVNSFLNEDLPIDDCTPDETSTESNENDSKLEGKNKDNERSNNSNVFDDIIEQLDKEKSTTNKEKEQNNSVTITDFDESKDIKLLDKFGLKIIKLPEIEDVISLEERDQMNEKAIKFSNIYKNWPRIWSSKNAESSTLKQELQISFQQLLTETKLSFNLDVSLTELKRLANLINIWYTNNLNRKLIEKRKVSESTNRYLLMFHFIPKIVKRLYYCEYCEEHFSTEHKYFTHRIVHTGALYPYTCQKCTVGYKTAKQFKSHEPSCNFKKSKLNVTKPPQKTYENLNIRAHKCLVCKETFVTSGQLYEHSKKHLKTIYNCAKCELVFASAIDVHNHMSVCNTVAKRVPKQCTPRPTKQNKNRNLLKELI